MRVFGLVIFEGVVFLLRGGFRFWGGVGFFVCDVLGFISDGIVVRVRFGSFRVEVGTVCFRFFEYLGRFFYVFFLIFWIFFRGYFKKLIWILVLGCGFCFYDFERLEYVVGVLGFGYFL